MWIGSVRDLYIVHMPWTRHHLQYFSESDTFDLMHESNHDEYVEQHDHHQEDPIANDSYDEDEDVNQLNNNNERIGFHDDDNESNDGDGVQVTERGTTIHMFDSE